MVRVCSQCRGARWVGGVVDGQEMSSTPWFESRAGCSGIVLDVAEAVMRPLKPAVRQETHTGGSVLAEK